eukprot:scaffold24621_cov57-Phaeocystis_antarctica.AAC.2
MLAKGSLRHAGRSLSKGERRSEPACSPHRRRRGDAGGAAPRAPGRGGPRLGSLVSGGIFP